MRARKVQNNPRTCIYNFEATVSKRRRNKMSHTTSLFDQIQLAEASYANLFDTNTQSTITNPDDVKQSLVNKQPDGSYDFSEVQATEFIQHWKVVNHQPNEPSGFSATLFESIDRPGEYTLAFRGTEQFNADILSADFGGITLQGAAFNQIVDMYNYWQRLITPTNQHVRTAKIVTTADGTASNIFDSGTVTDESGNAYQLYVRIEFEDSTDYGLGLNLNNLNVTGHSLGGHLAIAIMRLFGDQIGATAYLANGAGFHNTQEVENFFNTLAEQPTQFSNANIERLYGTAGPGIISNDPIFNYYGTFTPTFTETAEPLAGTTFGHGVGQLTDSLAVYDLFIRMDSSLQGLSPHDAVVGLTSIFEAASNEADTSLEHLVNALGDLFGVFNDQLPRLPMTHPFDRNDLFARINAIRENINARDLSVVSLAGKSAAELKFKAEGLVEPDNAIAYRYALVNLNPFAIGDYTDTLYTSHNQHGELDLYDPNATTNPGALTEQYLTDRAAMLAAVIQANTNDAGAVIVNSGDSFTYQDVERNLTLDVLNTANFGGLLPPLQYKVIFGDNNDDTLTGTNGNDRIYAGGGNDTLNGGAGGDYLEGGRGDDAYVGLNEHDTVLDVQGNDSYQLTGNADATITDVDGIGDIAWDGTPVTGGSLQSGDTNADGAAWQSADGVFTYTRSGADLLISKSGDAGYATLKHFNFTDAASGLGSNDTLGINFSGAAARSGHALTSDSDTYTTAPGETAVLGLDGNDIITVTTPYVPGASVFGGDGNDSLYVRDARDYYAALLQGGTAALPDPTARGVDLFGEGGNDFIEGSLKADTLNGGDGVNWLSGLFGDDTLIGGPRTDLLHGNADTDLLIGGGGGDQLFGGAQADTLVGGPGNDVLWGDAESVGQQFQPDAIDETATGWRDGNYNRNLGAIPLPAIGGVDIVIAEAHGNAAGDDVLDGGAGEDQLYREAV